jgi:hypothetical protein
LRRSFRSPEGRQLEITKVSNRGALAPDLDTGVQRTPENSTPTSFRDWCEEVLKPAVLDQTTVAAG